ncbi:MAG: pyridoxal 5'-phosphate synthase glutaminase subunit PdxT [Armatimonadetes bacterium]|nr:pyridoxal 5'-phosphate synthase glutaminase subunit PdxT [Armatimonadota bacterium]
MRIGVLALQGDFAKHIDSLHRCGAEAFPLRYAEELGAVDGLVIPGGESTTVGKLMDRFGITEPLRERAVAGLPVYGTCTGLILLAKEILDSRQPRIGVMNITVERNAYGRQIDSFEADVSIQSVEGGPFRAVFIRAPIIRSVGESVEVLCEHNGNPIMARQGSLLGTSFHPELTDDLRVHQYFLSMTHP